MRAYAVTRQIGEGSFGKALLASNKKSGRVVVVKQVRLDGLTAVEVEAAKREASVLASLAHPAIIGCVEAFVEDGALCIVTDFAESGDVSKLIEGRKHQPLSEGKLLDWFAQLCLALAYMHRKRLLHRDLSAFGARGGARGPAAA